MRSGKPKTGSNKIVEIEKGMVKMKLRYGLIGAGRVAPNHVKAFWENKEELEFAAYCDIDPAAGERLRQGNPQALDGVPFYTDYHEMIAKEKLDIVSIATFSGTHAAIALDCLEKNINLIIEKPIAMSLEDADRIVALSEEKGLVVSANHQNRFNKPIQKVREALEAGRFGKLLHGTTHILWARDKNYYDSATWRGTWEQDGGALMNQCIHAIDLLRWMMGDEVEEVMAYTANLMHPYIEAEDLGMALVKFKNGSYGMIEGTVNVYNKNLEETLYIMGETGMAKVGGTSVNTLDAWRFSDGQDSLEALQADCNEHPDSVYGFGHTAVLRDVIRAVREGGKAYIDARAGRRALEMVLAIYLSAKTGKPVKLPLERCSSLDFKGLFD